VAGSRELVDVNPRKSAIWALLLSVSLATQPQAKDDASSRYAPTSAVAYPGGVQNLRDVTYAELPGFRPLTLDLYLPPPGGAPKPAVVFVHGGAWRHLTARDGGTFRDFPAVLASVAARGYVVASVNYRFVGEARFPGPVQDVEMAIRWMRMHATDYSIDPTRFIAWGSSAGGQIATVIGTGCGVTALEPPAPANTEGPLPSVCVQGVIDWYGLIDLESNAVELGKADVPGAHVHEDAYLGCEIPKCPPGLARSASPLAYIDPKDPPFLIQHGAADTTVAPKQAHRLYDALRAAGVPAELVLYPNVAHGFAKVPGGGPDDAVNEQALGKVFEFLHHYFPTPNTPIGKGASEPRTSSDAPQSLVARDPYATGRAR
jgi:acetyl esterase/lipase